MKLGLLEKCMKEGALINLDVITMDDLKGFSEELQEQAGFILQRRNSQGRRKISGTLRGKRI